VLRLQLNIVISNCEDFGILFESLLNIRGEEFLHKQISGRFEGPRGGRKHQPKRLVRQGLQVHKVQHDIQVLAMNIQLAVDAHALFTRRFDILMSEIENATILEEIKLEKMKYETINSKQLKFMYRNSHITLVGLLLTALLTVANIIVTSIQDQKSG